MGSQAPPLKWDASVVSLGSRFFRSATVAASPAAATETIIASLTVDADLVVQKGIQVQAFAAYLLGASGTSSNVRIRKTDVSGTILKATGVILGTAADLLARSLVAFDTSPVLPNQVYVLTLEVENGAAASTVSAVELAATVY